MPKQEGESRHQTSTILQRTQTSSLWRWVGWLSLHGWKQPTNIPLLIKRKNSSQSSAKLSSCRWQKATSPRSPRRIQGDKWRRMTSLRFSTLPSLQGRCVSHVIEKNFCIKFKVHGQLFWDAQHELTGLKTVWIGCQSNWQTLRER